MTDRDTFAAAALTGLLADTVQRDLSVQMTCVAAYKWADAMLREREKSRAGKNDAETVPEAAKCTERETATEWDQWQAVIDRLKGFGCWETAADVWEKREEFLKRPTNHDAAPAAKAYADGEPAPKCGGEAGSSPRDGTGNTQEPVAWAAHFDDEDEPDGDFTFGSLENARAWCGCRAATPAPLYRSPTLTDEEREAIAVAIVGSLPGRAATLRSLLARLA